MTQADGTNAEVFFNPRVLEVPDGTAVRGAARRVTLAADALQ